MISVKNKNELKSPRDIQLTYGDGRITITSNGGYIAGIQINFNGAINSVFNKDLNRFKNLTGINYQVINDGNAAQNNSISQFNISPEDDVISEGFNQGEYIAYYNFLTKPL